MTSVWHCHLMPECPPPHSSKHRCLDYCKTWPPNQIKSNLSGPFDLWLRELCSLSFVGKLFLGRNTHLGLDEFALSLLQQIGSLLLCLCPRPHLKTFEARQEAVWLSVRCLHPHGFQEVTINAGLRFLFADVLALRSHQLCEQAQETRHFSRGWKGLSWSMLSSKHNSQQLHQSGHSEETLKLGHVCQWLSLIEGSEDSNLVLIWDSSQFLPISSSYLYVIRPKLSVSFGL